MTLFAAIPHSARRPLLWLAGAAVLLPVIWWATLPDDDVVPVEVTAPAPSPLAAPTPTSAPALPVPAPMASPEGLKLHGVLGGSGPNASAIIGKADGGQMLVRIGRAVMPGLVLTRIERDAAIFEQNGSAYRLSLVDGSGASRLTPVSAGQGSAADTGNGYYRKDATAESVEFRQALTPHRINGQITGFAIRPGNDVDLFRKAGLKPGDIVTTINGRAFASEGEVNGLAREIGVSAMLEIGYERDGVHQETRVTIAR